MTFVSAGITPEFNARKGPPPGERCRGTIAAPLSGPVLRRMQLRVVGARVAERITHTCATVREDVLAKTGCVAWRGSLRVDKRPVSPAGDTYELKRSRRWLT